jgi:hypothetical protein
MPELAAQDVTVRAHLSSDGEGAHGAIFVGRLGAYRFQAERKRDAGWEITFVGDPEIPHGLHEHLVAAALSSIGVAEGLHRHRPPAILSVELVDLKDEEAEFSVDVRDIFVDAGIAQGFVTVPGKGRFTFQADQRPEVGWSVIFGLDFPLPQKVASRLERVVLDQIEQFVGRASEA